MDVEDSAWCSFVLGRLGYKDSEYAGKDWIRSERNLGAWGYCRRDTPCIPITALVSWLRPDMADSEAFDWLSETWREDLRSSYKLSYKGAWYLLARSSDAERDISLCAETVSWLVSDQRWEGGWGAYKRWRRVGNERGDTGHGAQSARP